jgi:hypothetical protein
MLAHGIHMDYIENNPRHVPLMWLMLLADTCVASLLLILG